MEATVISGQQNIQDYKLLEDLILILFMQNFLMFTIMKLDNRK